jgi:hypothetical protein
MDYMFLLYSDEAKMAQLTPEERRITITRHFAISDEAKARGVFKGANPLQPTLTAKTVRSGESKTTITDGPYAETKEGLGGYYIIDCASPAEAEYWATRLATTVCGVCVEYRQIREVPARVTEQTEAAVLVNG